MSRATTTAARKSHRNDATIAMESQKKIAVLDDYQGFSKPAFDELAPQYEVSYFPHTLLPYNHPDTPQAVKDELARRLEPFHIISTMRERTPFPGELARRLPRLQLLLTTGARNASLDLDAFKERGVPVCGTGGEARSVGPDSTTQHCVALILAIARGLAQDDAAVKSGQWQTSFATGLAGKTLGLLGLGRLGTSVAYIMHAAFGMGIIAWSTNLTQDKADGQARHVGLPARTPEGLPTFEAVSRDELFSRADVLSVHLVLSARSRGLVNAQDLARMKPSSYFVNTSRGPLVVEEDLIRTLEAGNIRGAAIDVFDLEPLPADSPWRSTQWGKGGRSQVLVTPHMGYMEEGNVRSWYAQQVENIKRWAAGEALKTVLA